MTTILTKKKDTTGAPAPGDLTNAAGGAELAVNTFDKRLYTKDSGGNVVEIGTNPSTITTTTVDTTNLEVTAIKAKDGTASATIANSTGVMTIGSSVLTTTDINGGTIDGTSIGASSASSGAFTTLSASSTATLNTLSSSGATITGGSINNTPIGASTANTGAFTTLSASGVATFSAGTVSAPAITTTGDTNTGIFFPAADTIAFTEGGVESMRIDSSGNVGIGISSPTRKFQVAGDIAVGTLGVSGTYAVTYNPDTAGNIVFWTKSDNYFAWGTGSNPYSGGTERMRIDSSGNVGIGTSSPAQKLDMNGATARFSNGSYIGYLGAGSLLVGGAATDFTLRSDNVLSFGTGGPYERMRIDASGNVGIGTSTAGRTLTVAPVPFSAGNLGGIRLINTSNNTSSIFEMLYGLEAGTGIPFGSLRTGNDGNSYMTFFTGTGPTERMRIDSSGNLLVGTTTTAAGRVTSLITGTSTAFWGKNSGGATNATIVAWNDVTTGNPLFADFYTETSATQRGSIAFNRGAGLTTYNTTSDYRAKDIISAVLNSGEVIDSVPVYMGKMKGATQERPMFIAHETPDYAHTGEKDAVDKDGKPIYQQMDVSSLVPVLWAEIQSLRKRVAQLESK